MDPKVTILGIHVNFTGNDHNTPFKEPWVAYTICHFCSRGLNIAQFGREGAW